MAYRITYLPAVKLDLKEAKNWYETRGIPNLEQRLVADIDKALERIKAYPFAHAVRYRNVRICHTDLFPYNLYYYVDDVRLTIILIAIVHDRQNPAKIFQRV